jgi:hypothetical protein
MLLVIKQGCLAVFTSVRVAKPSDTDSSHDGWTAMLRFQGKGALHTLFALRLPVLLPASNGEKYRRDDLDFQRYPHRG